MTDQEILNTLNFSPQAPVQLPHAGATTLVDALLNHLQITRLTRKMIEAYATIGQCHTLSRLLIAEQRSDGAEGSGRARSAGEQLGDDAPAPHEKQERLQR